jgi:hypothetical protein
MADDYDVVPWQAVLQIAAIVAAAILIIWLFATIAPAHAHDQARPDLDNWFMALHAKGGAMCCDGTEAVHISDVDWKPIDASCVKAEKDPRDGHYCVQALDKWWVIPDYAWIEGPNRFGEALLWATWRDDDGVERIANTGHHVSIIYIRCFMPGPET